MASETFTAQDVRAELKAWDSSDYRWQNDKTVAMLEVLAERLEHGEAAAPGESAAIVAAVAAISNPHYDSGFGDSTCFFCGWSDYDGHASDCAWKRARASKGL